MPIDQPNIEANPVQLEANVFVTRMRGEGEYVSFFNAGATTYQDGEPFTAGGVTWISQRRILPGEVGPRCSNFLVEAVVDPALAAAIDQDDIVYIDTDLADSDNPIGYATNVLPTNGFVLGRACVDDGANSVVACAVGGTHVLVRSAPADFAEYSV